MKFTERRTLPRTGQALPVLGLGCAPLGGLFRAMADEQAQALLDTAWRRGVRWFDTAPYYGYTRSERRLGQALARWPRTDVLLSTKVGRLMRPDESVRPGDDGWADPLPFRPHFDYSHDGVLRSFDDSLRRLGVDHVDVLYVHDIGRVTHGAMHDTRWRELTHGGGFRALEALRRSGAVGAIGVGVNEWPAAHAALQAFDLDVVMLAGRYTLLEQGALSPFLSACEQRRCGVVVAGPFNSGVLAGGDTFDYSKAPPEVVARVRALAEVAREFSVPLTAAALQFPLAHPAVVSCMTGARDATELEQNLASLEVAIPAAFWHALRERLLVDASAPLPVA